MGKRFKHRGTTLGIVILMLCLSTMFTIRVESRPTLQEESPLEYESHTFPPPPIEPGWMRPTGYNDPENAWIDETKAFDGYVATKAGCKITELFARWTPWLELTLSSQIICNKIRFYAWYDDLHCNMIHFDLYYSGDWHHMYEGGYTDREWVNYSFGTISGVTKARVSFHVNRLLWDYVVADLHEFQFFGYC
ncbi:MAG: hypothetical protein NT038_08635 [Euryarchaeota archaeon]|nr:hypothetical protein [Euryarchaeota archaeon]